MNGDTHEQFVELFHRIGSGADNRVVILTGSVLRHWECAGSSAKMQATALRSMAASA